MMRQWEYVMIAVFMLISASCATIPRQQNSEILDYYLFNKAVAYYGNVRSNNHTALWNMASGYAKNIYANDQEKFSILMRTKYGGSRGIKYYVPAVIAKNGHFAVTENHVQHYADLPYICERIVWVREDNEWYFADVRIGCSRFPTRKEFIQYSK
jgi:hypothetical protein